MGATAPARVATAPARYSLDGPFQRPSLPLSADGAQWIAPTHPAFLLPVEALSGIFRAKICAAVTKAGFLGQVPSTVWKQPWVVHCQPAGQGLKVLEYLGRYVFRIAISNSRIERIEDGQVTFR